MTRRVRLAVLLTVAWIVPSAARAEDHEQHEHKGAALVAGEMPRTPRPADAKLYIISPKNGDTVKSPVTVRFGLTGMGVAPAGVGTDATGHHHLIIDSPLPPLDAPLPKDDKHVHFGGGQTEATVTLAPGKHTLQMVLGDKDHVPHDPPLVSEQITITVE